ncbi:MAG: DUF3108 domain-containing protein [Rhodospirillaceae bacterium]|nr:DUF3108 domain-containing protein [Rhodospirillaceae bacterium]
MAFSIHSLARVFGLFAALAAGLAAGPVRAAELTATPGNGLKLAYDVYTGGVHVVVLDVGLSYGADDYKLTVAAETRGFIGWMFPWQSKITSHGLFNATQALPSLYRTDSLFRGTNRLVEIDYAKNGLKIRIEPPSDDDERDRVGEDMRRGTLDPLSGIFAAIRAIADGGGCDRTVPVFDGRRRYDFVVDRGGREKLAASSYSSFAGDALLCHFRMERRAGFWRQERAGEVRGLEDGLVWLAPVAGGTLPVPVRVQAISPFGSAFMHLRDAQSLPPANGKIKASVPIGSSGIKPASPVGSNG